jgi:hypothetical protein
MNGFSRSSLLMVGSSLESVVVHDPEDLKIIRSLHLITAELQLAISPRREKSPPLLPKPQFETMSIVQGENIFSE